MVLSWQSEWNKFRFIHLFFWQISWTCWIKEKEKSSAELSYLIGSIYYNKSIAEARGGNYLQALWTSNQMKSNLEEAVRINPNYYDAFLGLGLYNFALSQIPSTLEWAANLVGITADKELGLTYVKRVLQKVNYLKLMPSIIYLNYTHVLL